MFLQDPASPIGPLPYKLGVWRSQHLSNGPDIEQRLEGILVRSKEYLNAFNERIAVLVFASDKESSEVSDPARLFRDFGYRVTATQPQQPFPGKPQVVTALILQNGASRMLLYHWSSPLSNTSSPDSLPQTSSFPIWIYTFLHTADINAAQARRNFNELGGFLIDSLPKSKADTNQATNLLLGAPATGSDALYLTASLRDDKPGWGKNLLPLTKGTVWEMRSVCEGKTSRDRLVVVGLVSEAGIAGTQIDILREGKKWRRDLYRRQGNQVLLVATEDESSDLMGYHPAIPLFEEPAVLGKALTWSGDFFCKGSQKPATAYSRISSKESMTTPAGKFTVYRIDTIVIVHWDKQEIRFPMVRWLAAGVGFVSRGFADKGIPAFSHLVAYKIR